MPVLEMILAKIKQRDLEAFEEKMQVKEGEVEASIEAQGLKSVNSLIQERQDNANLDYEKDIAGPEAILESEQKPKEEKLTGKEMFDKFLEQLR